MATFTPNQPYVVRKPMQIYWDSNSAIARRETHGGGMQQPTTVYIDPAYRENLLPAIPVRTAPSPSGYTLGWLNINENASGVPNVYIGVGDGQVRKAKAIYIGVGNGAVRKCTALFIGNGTGVSKAKGE